jgi:hypothetical protein
MSKKKDPYLDQIRKAIKGKIKDVYIPELDEDLSLLTGKSHLVYVRGILENTKHQRRTTRNLLDLVRKNGYLGAVIPLCNNFPNRGKLRQEMTQFGLRTVFLELKDNTMIYLGKKV